MPRTDEPFRIAVMGDGGVGKSTFVIRLVYDFFVEKYDPTIEDSYRVERRLAADSANRVIEILDTAGTESFTAMRDLYIKMHPCILVCFSLISQATFNDVTDLVEQILRVKDLEYPVNSPENLLHGEPVSIVLVGTKADLAEQRIVSFEDARQLALDKGLSGYVETSAKHARGIDEALELVLGTYETRARLKYGHRERPEARGMARLFPWNWANGAIFSRKRKNLAPREPTEVFSRAENFQPRLPPSEVEIAREMPVDSLDLLESEVFADLAAAFSHANPSLGVATKRPQHSAALVVGFRLQLETAPDAAICVENRLIMCHRFVLALRSSYFRALLEEVRSKDQEKDAEDEMEDELRVAVSSIAGETGSSVIFQVSLDQFDHPEITFDLVAECIRLCYDPVLKSSMPLGELCSLENLNRSLFQIGDLSPTLTTAIDGLKQLQEQGKTDQPPALAKTKVMFADSAAIELEMAPALSDLLHLADVRLTLRDVAKRGGRGKRVKKFKVHEVVLSSRSRYFASLITEARLRDHQKGRLRSVVRISMTRDDIEPDILELVLNYLYTGRVPSSQAAPDNLIDLLAAADLLRLPRLTQICEAGLEPLISVESVVALWLAADFRSANRLKTLCEQFISRALDAILESEAVHSDANDATGERNLIDELPPEVRCRCRDNFEELQWSVDQRQREEREISDRLREQNFLALQYERVAPLGFFHAEQAKRAPPPFLS